MADFSFCYTLTKLCTNSTRTKSRWDLLTEIVQLLTCTWDSEEDPELIRPDPGYPLLLTGQPMGDYVIAALWTAS